MSEHRLQFTFKGKRQHIAKVNIPNIAYLNQHINIEIRHSSRNHVAVPLSPQTKHVVLLKM